MKRIKVDPADDGEEDETERQSKSLSSSSRIKYKQQFEFSQQEVRSLTEANTKLKADLDHERSVTKRLSEELKQANQFVRDLQAQLLKEKEDHASFLKDQFTKGQQVIQSVHNQYTTSLEHQQHQTMNLLKQSLKHQQQQVYGILNTVKSLLQRQPPKAPTADEIKHLVEQRKVRYEMESHRKATREQWEADFRLQMEQAQARFRAEAGQFTSEIKEKILSQQRLIDQSKAELQHQPSSSETVQLLQTISEAEKDIQLLNQRLLLPVSEHKQLVLVSGSSSTSTFIDTSTPSSSSSNSISTVHHHRPPIVTEPPSPVKENPSSLDLQTGLSASRSSTSASSVSSSSSSSTTTTRRSFA